MKKSRISKTFYEDDGSDDGGGHDMSMLYPLHEDGPEYIRGFEQGQIAEMIARNIPVNRPVRPRSIPQLETMAKAHGARYTVTRINDEWCAFQTFQRTDPHPNDHKPVFAPAHN